MLTPSPSCSPHLVDQRLEVVHRRVGLGHKVVDAAAAPVQAPQPRLQRARERGEARRQQVGLGGAEAADDLARAAGGGGRWARALPTRPTARARGWPRPRGCSLSTAGPAALYLVVALQQALQRLDPAAVLVRLQRNLQRARAERGRVSLPPAAPGKLPRRCGPARRARLPNPRHAGSMPPTPHLQGDGRHLPALPVQVARLQRQRAQLARKVDAHDARRRVPRQDGLLERRDRRRVGARGPRLEGVALIVHDAAREGEVAVVHCGACGRRAPRAVGLRGAQLGHGLLHARQQEASPVDGAWRRGG